MCITFRISNIKKQFKKLMHNSTLILIKYLKLVKLYYKQTTIWIKISWK